MASQSQQDARAFRFRLRHDQILRQRLRHAKLKAIQDLAAELGYRFDIMSSSLRNGIFAGHK